MNKIAIITAFLGGVKNRYMQYEPNRTIEEKFDLATEVVGLQGLELCYPQEFEDPGLLGKLLQDSGLGVSAINVRSRRQGKWWRGSFSSALEEERREVVDDFKKALDTAAGLGVYRITTCPLNEGHDYVFEMDYLDAYKYTEETLAEICAHNKDVKVCIEYKWNDPRTRSLIGSAGEALAFCQGVGKENLGVTLDIGHSIQAGERPAQALAMLHRAGRLFYVHLNDNDRNWDWDLLPAAYNFWDTVEFFYYLEKVGYTDDWYAYDIMSKEIDTVQNFNVANKITRKMEKLAASLDENKITELLDKRNPVSSIKYLFDTLLP
jgi:xylose isomerase